MTASDSPWPSRLAALAAATSTTDAAHDLQHLQRAHSADPLGAGRPLHDKAFALDHIEVKLSTLPATMNTAAARRLGEARLQWLRDFRAQFVDEWGAAATVPPR
ncbi:hypothetical protein [Zoogloea sp.]|uniref:hypothetical protein n=1 Tax=Zoogloea sp. TaxID=49181 RepID=UPI0035AEED4A